MINPLSKKVLLLNSSYEPMMIIGAKRAVVLFFLDKVDFVEKTKICIRSEKNKIFLPSVIKLKTYIYMTFNKIPLTRKNILQRDNYTCQYCGKFSKNITIDHIVPKDKNGKDSWSNLVSACSKCNHLKSNKLLNDTSMRLLKKPARPQHINFMQKFINEDYKSWKPYLFMEKN
tara:strand:+ start:52 stop:570 length:519 start_codon:yes stop_codon:yes gene_type:complete